MIKKYVTLSLLLFFSLTVCAQVEKMPSFGLTRTNGQQFLTTALHKDRPTLLVYFAPDCEHCITFLNALFKDMSPFSRSQVLLVTFKPLRDLLPVERSYRTASFRNVIVGTELKPLYLQTYYRLQNTPFVALFDKNGILIRAYRKEAAVKDLAKLVANLK